MLVADVSGHLIAGVEEVLRGRPGRFGVYARHLVTGEVVAINDSDVFPAESTVKTAILLHYERCVDAGTVDPKQRVNLVPERRFDGSVDALRTAVDDALARSGLATG